MRSKEKVKSNKQKVTSNEQKATSNEQRAKIFASIYTNWLMQNSSSIKPDRFDEINDLKKVTTFGYILIAQNFFLK